MAALKTKDVQSALLKKGFELDAKNGNTDHIYFRFFYEGKKTAVRTKLSRNRKDLRDPLIKYMSEQMRLDKKDFLRFVECTLSKERYTQILLEEKQIP